MAGGGYFRTNTYKANGGNGGGTAGTSGSYSNSTYSAYVGGGASQSTGGTRGHGSSSNYYGKAGTFGTGGDTGYKYNSTSYYSNGAGGGGWYGGGAAGNYSSASTARLAGGGGGSGFVWSTGKTRPDGYLVDEKYYLEDAATYSATETGFVTNPVTTGNGYLRITLIETKTTAEATATRWKNIEYQTEQGTFTGNFDYNVKTITHKDTENNTIIHQKVNEIQYIEATGTQYIDTGCTINKTDNCVIELEAQFPTENRTDVFMGANGYGQLKISNIYSISSSTGKTVGNKDKVTITYLNTTETLAVNGTTVETKSWSSAYNGQNVKIRSI